MDYVKKLLSKNEIDQVEEILFKRFIISDDMFTSNIIDYDNHYSKESSMDLIVNFLNNFSTVVDDEIEFHDQIPIYVLKIYLIKPISEKKFFEFKVDKQNDSYEYYATYNGHTEKIDPMLLNTIMAYLVSHGLVFDFELESTIKRT